MLCLTINRCYIKDLESSSRRDFDFVYLFQVSGSTLAVTDKLGKTAT